MDWFLCQLTSFFCYLNPDPRFLKGIRIQPNHTDPKNWFNGSSPFFMWFCKWRSRWPLCSGGGEGRGVKPTKTNISASFENYMFVRENCVRDYIDIIDKQALMLSINGQNLLNITNIHALYSVGLEKKRIIFILN